LLADEIDPNQSKKAEQDDDAGLNSFNHVAEKKKKIWK